MTETIIVWTDGVVYVSTVDNNSWTPADYPQGWKAYTK